MENERASKREDTRPKPFMAAVHRMELPRRWFIAMSDKPDKFALRREPLRQVPAQFALITDASPRGVGAIFADIDRQSRAIVPSEALEIPFTEEYARWMGIPWDDPAGQGPLEAWAILMAIRTGRADQSRQRGGPCNGGERIGAITRAELDWSGAGAEGRGTLPSKVHYAADPGSMECGSRLAEPSTPTRTNTKTAGRGANASVSKGKNNDVGFEPPWNRCSIEMGPSIQSGVGRL